MTSTFSRRMAWTASWPEVLKVEEEERRFLVVELAPEVVVEQWTRKATAVETTEERLMTSTFLRRMTWTASRPEVLEVEEEERWFLVVELAPEVVVEQWTRKAKYIRLQKEKGEERSGFSQAC
ncbi:hypothetical protein SLEP1_g55072 [Rubroshorea leprosula]|uniref:Uncharacterized protein n=1 Tax=Rubroshorea leprosula TaxID=152421 RepID=A0AAV5MEB1_9ROSI|nr:hypothetical protein SLEP1_g55072 [Rubroshorea leprosula]